MVLNCHIVEFAAGHKAMPGLRHYSTIFFSVLFGAFSQALDETGTAGTPAK